MTLFVCLTIGAAPVAAPAQTDKGMAAASFRVAQGSACPPEYAYTKVEADGSAASYVCELKAAESERKAAWPVALPLSRFGTVTRSRAPLGTPLTAPEERRLLAAAATFNLPKYVYSGCHDRAHAAYMLLPPDLRAKVMKVWVVAPKMYTPGVGGFISLAQAPQGLPNVEWGYHVALAYTADTGIRVLDPSLAGETSPSLESWFAKLRFPSLTFWTLSEGTAYLFFPEESKDVFVKDKNGKLVEKPMQFLRNKGIWGGNFHGYEGASRDEAYIPVALARDEVGVRALGGQGCNTVRTLAVEPGQLLDFLQKGASADCAGEAAMFRDRIGYWTTRLH